MGKKKEVIFIDLDPSAGGTISITGDTGEPGTTVIDVINDTVSAEEAFVEKDGLKLLSAGIEMKAVSLEGFVLGGKLKKALKEYEYHHWVIDFPPNLGKWMIAGMRIVKDLVVPIDMQYLSLRGLTHLMDLVELVQEINPDLEIAYVVCNKFDSRKRLTRDVLSQIEEKFGKNKYHTIRENISLAEAPLYQQSIYEYKSKSHGAEDFRAFSKKISRKKDIKVGVVNHKGGVGKTTVAVNLAFGLANKVWKNGS